MTFRHWHESPAMTAEMSVNARVKNELGNDEYQTNEGQVHEAPHAFGSTTWSLCRAA